MLIIFLIAGLFLLIPTIMFLTLYVENILFLDSLVLSVLSAIWIRAVTGIHPVFCILAGIGVLAGMMMLYSQRCLFWVFTAMSSMLWGSMIGVLLQGITGGVWSTFLGATVGLATLLFHMTARGRYYE